MRYVIVLKDPADIETIREIVGDKGLVGNPRAAARLVIVECGPDTILQIASRVPHQSIDEDCPVDMDTIIDPDPPGWALAWISDSNGTYEIDESGAGVDIYILDTGIRTDHKDFEGRASVLWSYDGQDYDPNNDQAPWHGTAVASCAGGRLYGTAKQAALVGVRIDWTFSGIIKALDKVVEHHLNKDDERQSIVNFSGSSPRRMLGDIFNEVIDYGITVVASSSNEGEPDPRYPARHPWIVAVGALEESEAPAGFSNRGANVWGPGAGILAASIDSDISSHVISGTSFSAPYHAGLMAASLTDSDKFNTRSHVSQFMFDYSSRLTDRRRIPSFPNGPFQVRTSSTRTFRDPFYLNTSLEVPDEEIKAFVMAYVDHPKVIADAARDNNVSLGRLSDVTGFDREIINQYFADHNVVPWWSR